MFALSGDEAGREREHRHVGLPVIDDGSERSSAGHSLDVASKANSLVERGQRRKRGQGQQNTENPERNRLRRVQRNP